MSICKIFSLILSIVCGGGGTVLAIMGLVVILKLFGKILHADTHNIAERSYHMCGHLFNELSACTAVMVGNASMSKHIDTGIFFLNKKIL